LEALLESFLVPDSRERIARKVAVCRCLFGALVAWRFAHVYGFSVVADDPMQVRWYAGVGAVLGAAICVGLLSQVCLCLLALVFLVQAPFASTLGDQVALLTAYGLILAGSSEAWAVDRIVLPRCASPLSRKLLRLFALPFTPESFACLRVALIALFWGICFTAMSFHFLDELWARSRVLHLLFTMPYMSSLYPWMSRAAESAPVLYDFLCRTALWAQGAWELFLLPLMFWRWGRLFAKWQGLAFFLVSAVGINLDYLPFTELVFWLLVFNYRVPRTVAAPRAPVPLLPKALAWGRTGRRLELRARHRWEKPIACRIRPENFRPARSLSPLPGSRTEPGRRLQSRRHVDGAQALRAGAND